MSQIKGKISQIIGPVVDVSFENAEKLYIRPNNDDDGRNRDNYLIVFGKSLSLVCISHLRLVLT